MNRSELKNFLKPFKTILNIDLRSNKDRLQRYYDLIQQRQPLMRQIQERRRGQLKVFEFRYSLSFSFKYKDQRNDNTYTKEIDDFVIIRANSLEDAHIQFINNVDIEDLEANVASESQVDDGSVSYEEGSFESQVFERDNVDYVEQADIPMTNAMVYTPSFVKYVEAIDESAYDDMNGQCVYESLINYYQGTKRMKKLTKESIFNIFKRYVDTHYKSLHIYDEFDYNTGVSANMIRFWCYEKGISCYGYDMNDNSVVKYIHNRSNFKPLVFYSYGEHFYIITDDKWRKTIFQSERKKTQTAFFNEEKTKKIVKNIHYDLDVEQVIDMTKNKEFKNTKIIYTEDKVKDLLKCIIKKHNIIPKIDYGSSKFCKKITLPNNIELEEFNCKIAYTPNEVERICIDNNIPFENQSFGNLVIQLADNFKNKRKFLKDSEKQFVLNRQNNKCNMCKILFNENTTAEYDHIKPFCKTYDNSIKNFQALCKTCHKQKTEEEQETGTYMNFRFMNSYYNNKCRNLIKNKDYFMKYAFVQNVKTVNVKDVHENLENYHYLDINKCRTNCLINSDYDYKLPVFSSLDDVELFDGSIQEEGFYFIDTLLFFPTRGKKFYSRVMTQFLLDNDLISPNDIKYQYKASMSVDTNYFKDFMNFVKTSNKKHLMNTLIGLFGRTNEISHNYVKLTPSYEEAKLLYANQNDVSIYKIPGTDVYEISTKIDKQLDSDMLPFYHYIMDLEAIELFKMKNIIEQHGGDILQYNTDGVLFKGNQFDISNYTYKDGSLKYKYEKPKFLVGGKMENYISENEYFYEHFQYNDLNEIDENKGCLLLGRAGTGKSYKVREFVQKVGEDKCVVLASTNKASNNINGSTIHSWIKKYKQYAKKSLYNIEYIIVDEISMLNEIFYSLLLTIKKLNPEIKIIMVGDYCQLPPVSDRINKDTDFYKNSRALYEICDGNRIVLTECKRSDDTLFNLCKDVSKIDFSMFESKECLLNLAYTNKCVDKINDKYNIPRDNSVLINGWHLYTGQRLIGKITNKKNGIAKNKEYFITNIDDENITVDDIVIPHRDIKHNLLLGYCMTIHKSQGSTFDEEYCIYEKEKFDKALLYVALSRATDINNIFFN